MKRLLARLHLKSALEWLCEAECTLARRWVSSAHRRLFYAQWTVRPMPEHFDHHIDLYAHWLESRSPLWLERGVYGSLALQGGDVLELACGDGFNACNFYSLRARRVVACDFNPAAIRTASRKNAAPNVEFVLADIRTSMPAGQFANIVWDAAIEHFTPAEIEKILGDIRTRLAPSGVLSGYTLAARRDKATVYHEYEFADKEDLASFLRPHFAHVTVFETVYPTRHNLYFWASDTLSAIPFAPGWEPYVTK